METTGNQNVDLNSQFGTIVATHPHLQLNRNSILSRPPSISFVVHPCPSYARFCESRISSLILAHTKSPEYFSTGRIAARIKVLSEWIQTQIYLCKQEKKRQHMNYSTYGQDLHLQKKSKLFLMISTLEDKLHVKKVNES